MNNPNDLISRDAAIAWFFRPYSNEESYSNLDVERALKAIPAVDITPMVLHGRWIEKRWETEYDWGVHNHRAIICSACNNGIENGEKTCYCPNCGAKMKE